MLIFFKAAGKPIPPPKPKVKAGTLRLPSTNHFFDTSSSLSTSSPSPSPSSPLSSSPSTPALTPPTPPMKPQKLNRLAHRPQSSPDLNRLNFTIRGPKAEDITKLFASLGTADFGIYNIVKQIFYLLLLFLFYYYCHFYV